MSSSPAIERTVQQRVSYRADIDGLRALAILAVVAFHARLPYFSGGYIGVDIFFVISGYLIASLVYKDVRESRFSFLHFYERRAKRILPALLTVILVCDIIAFLLLSPLELRDYCAQSVATVASTSNVFYWLRSNYFNPVTAYKPLLMTWSLGVEEQFYLLFPLALLVLHKIARQRLTYWIALGCVASFGCSEMLLNLSPSATFYLLPTRAWELGIGVLLAVYELQRNQPVQLSRFVANGLGWLGLSLVLLPLPMYTESTRFPGLAAVLPVLGTACLIVAKDSCVNRRVLSLRPIVFIGLISYSWYLWHWPLMSFARIVSGGLLSVPRGALIAVFSLVVAVLSYRLIEQPFRKAQTQSRRLLPAYAMALLIFAIPPVIGYLHAGWPGRVPQLLEAEASVIAVEKNPCLAGFNEDTPRLTPPCLTSNGVGKIALLGDSHAASLGPGIREVALEHGYGFELLSKASCPPLAGVTLRWTLYPGFEKSCASFNHTVFQEVVTDPKVSTVVLAGFWSAPLSPGAKQIYIDEGRRESADSRADNDANLHSGLLRAIQLLHAANKRVIVATDVPRFELDPMSNVRNVMIKTRGELAAALTSRAFSLAPVPEQTLITPFDDVADEAVRKAAQDGGAEVLQIERSLCPAQSCWFWRDGVLLYSDVSHLTAAGAQLAIRGQDAVLFRSLGQPVAPDRELSWSGVNDSLMLPK